MLIAVTDNMGAEHKLQMYIDWLKRGDPHLASVVLSYLSDNIYTLEECDGIVLTGGGDVDPQLYGGSPNDPTLNGVDRKRDDFERGILDFVLKEEIPLLGICRGLQITNVHLGGTLIPDIVRAGYGTHESLGPGHYRHDLNAAPNSFLQSVTGTSRGNVNSSHHQAALLPGAGLKISANSDDSIIESLEMDDPQKENCFLLIQWHPERMTDCDNPFSKNILQAFLSSVRSHETIHSRKQY